MTTPLAPFLGLASTDPSNRAYIDFRALGTDPNNGDPATWTYTWNFGDGSDPVETLGWTSGSFGISAVNHEYASPGTYTVTVVFNNGIEDSPPATATVDVLPALDRDGRDFLIGDSCLSRDSEIHVTGRVDYYRVWGEYAGVRALWEGGFALGQRSLEELMYRGSYYLFITERDSESNWLGLGYLQPQLPDLSFDYTFALPTEPGGDPIVEEGEYVAVFVPAEDLKWFADWDITDYPIFLNEKPSIEGGESWTRIPFNIPCPEPENYKPIADANGPYEGSVGYPITLDGTGSYDPDGDDSALAFQWFVPGRPPEEGALEGPNPQVVFNEPGSYIVSLLVKDEGGDITYPSIVSPGSYANVTVHPMQLAQCIEDLSARPKSGKVQLTWTHQSDAECYNVYRSTSSDVALIPDNQLTACHVTTYSTYLDTNVVNNTTYYYKVTKVVGGGENCFSNEVSATPQERATR